MKKILLVLIFCGLLLPFLPIKTEKASAYWVKSYYTSKYKVNSYYRSKSDNLFYNNYKVKTPYFKFYSKYW